MEQLNSTKWYNKTWLVILLCIFFFPVGLYALWKNENIHTGWKVAVTAFFGLLLAKSIMDYDPKIEAEKQRNYEEQRKKEEELDLQSKRNENIKDSLENVEKQKQLQTEQVKISENQIKEVESNNYSAYDIDKAFEDNEISADEQFKGKEFYITGMIDDFDKGPFGGVYVDLKGKGFLPIRCEFKASEKSTLSQLTKGTTITIKGKCDGKTIGSVSFTNCTLYTQ